MSRWFRLAPVAMLLAVACSNGGGSPTGSDTVPPVLVEEARLAADGRFCRVRGTVFNRTATATYEVTLNFEGHDSLGRGIAQTTLVIVDLGPQARVGFRTEPLLGPLGEAIACSRIAELHQHDSDARCTSGTGPGCR